MKVNLIYLDVMETKQVVRSQTWWGTLMVWGCMAASGVGSLHFIDGIINKDVY